MQLHLSTPLRLPMCLLQWAHFVLGEGCALLSLAAFTCSTTGGVQYTVCNLSGLKTGLLWCTACAYLGSGAGCDQLPHSGLSLHGMSTAGVGMS